MTWGLQETSMLEIAVGRSPPMWSACRACSVWYRGRRSFLHIQRYFQPVQVGFITNICNVLFILLLLTRAMMESTNRFSRCRIWYFVIYTAVFLLSYLYFALYFEAAFASFIDFSHVLPLLKIRAPPVEKIRDL